MQGSITSAIDQIIELALSLRKRRASQAQFDRLTDLDCQIGERYFLPDIAFCPAPRPGIGRLPATCLEYSRAQGPVPGKPKENEWGYQVYPERWWLHALGIIRQREARLDEARQREDQIDELVSNRYRAKSLLAMLSKTRPLHSHGQPVDVYINALTAAVNFFREVGCLDALESMQSDGDDAKTEAAEIYKLIKSARSQEKIAIRLRELDGPKLTSFSIAVDQWLRHKLPREILAGVLGEHQQLDDAEGTPPWAELIERCQSVEFALTALKTQTERDNWVIDLWRRAWHAGGNNNPPKPKRAPISKDEIKIRTAVAKLQKWSEAQMVKEAAESNRVSTPSNVQIPPELPTSPTNTSSAEPKPPLPPTRHSIDFRSAHWFGQDYKFTESQAKVVALLWAAWENGTPDVGHRTLRDKAGLESDRLQDVFKEKGKYHPAWGNMISTNVGSKGTCRLQVPHNGS